MVGPLKTFLSVLLHLCPRNSPEAQITRRSEVLRRRWSLGKDVKDAANLPPLVGSYFMRSGRPFYSKPCCWETWIVM